VKLLGKRDVTFLNNEGIFMTRSIWEGELLSDLAGKEQFSRLQKAPLFCTDRTVSSSAFQKYPLFSNDETVSFSAFKKIRSSSRFPSERQINKKKHAK
jgi:hypothetical protein